MKHKVIGIIPARYQSTRFPGKPLALIKGKSLLQRTFESAKACKKIDALFIATDDKRIYDHAQDFCNHLIMTSKSCPNATARIAEAISHHKPLQTGTIFLNLQGDHPFISEISVAKTVEILMQDSKAIASTCATPFQDKKAALSPHLVKCVMDREQNALYFSRSPIPYAKNDEPTYYAHIGLYAYRKEFFDQYSLMTSTPLQRSEDLEQLQLLEYGYRIKVAIVDEEPLGVDIPEDIEKAEKYLCR